MKLVTAISTAALVLAPAVGLAQAPANGTGDTQDESGLKSKVERAIGKITGSSPDTKEGAEAKSGAAATNPGNTDYPDRAHIKKTDK
ncbi:MAG: hypothetical protein M3178_06195 [Pseudomonadota bacterium]|nr:hypothetical protein [Pseudomonadota bacterium]